jgi:Rieske Fe-S protein
VKHRSGKTKRREFLKNSAGLMALPLLWLASRMVLRNSEFTAPTSVSLKLPEQDGVYFHDDVILIRESGKVSALEARCTHLGCRIGGLRDEVLECPCHGSRYNLKGQVLKGPATGPLRKLSVAEESSGGMVTIMLDKS